MAAVCNRNNHLAALRLGLGNLNRGNNAAPNPRVVAQNLYAQVPNLQQQALARAPRNFVTLECLANAQLYAKTDLEKHFYLWDVRRRGDIQVRYGHDARTQHRTLVDLFVRPDRYRFPYNPADTHHDHSLSPASIQANLLHPNGTVHRLPRWSTASRSNMALIPLRGVQDLQVVANAQLQLDTRTPTVIRARDPAVHVAEWQALQQQLQGPANARTDFAHRVGSPGRAARSNGTRVGNIPFRLYSIKTGVDYVGSKFEGPGGGGKHRLEANSTMAMDRSDVMLRAGNRDMGLGIQGEILTITAPLRTQPVTRDGIQVRDLSCMRAGVDYVPGHALPFAHAQFDPGGGVQAQVDFWRRSFAVPLGRAKARMMLNYGLIHTSANAQNFVLGFAGRRLVHFVIRDVGDTSWHDTYLANVLRGSSLRRAYDAMDAESRTTQRHTLTETGSGDYPPPDIVRLAVASVLTHGWGNNMQWNFERQRHFATGVFDGFRAYIDEVFRLGLDYPAPGNIAIANQLGDARIQQELGFECRYPYYPFNNNLQGRYRVRVAELTRASSADLLQQAAWARERGRQLLAAGMQLGRLNAALHAEEALLCGAVDNLLRDANHAQLTAQVERCQRNGWPPIIR